MVTVTLLRTSGPFARANLDAMPGDGRRHELIGRVLIVTPSPRFRHQDTVGQLHLLLSHSVRPISRWCSRRSTVR